MVHQGIRILDIEPIWALPVDCQGRNYSKAGLCLWSCCVVFTYLINSAGNCITCLRVVCTCVSIKEDINRAHLELRVAQLPT